MLVFKGEGAADGVEGPMVEARRATPTAASGGVGIGPIGLHQ